MAESLNNKNVITKKKEKTNRMFQEFECLAPKFKDTKSLGSVGETLVSEEKKFDWEVSEQIQKNKLLKKRTIAVGKAGNEKANKNMAFKRKNGLKTKFHLNLESDKASEDEKHSFASVDKVELYTKKARLTQELTTLKNRINLLTKQFLEFAGFVGIFDAIPAVKRLEKYIEDSDAVILELQRKIQNINNVNCGCFCFESAEEKKQRENNKQQLNALKNSINRSKEVKARWRDAIKKYKSKEGQKLLDDINTAKYQFNSYLKVYNKLVENNELRLYNEKKGVKVNI